MDMHVDNIFARYILNSRGLPTLETDVTLRLSQRRRVMARAAVAFGISCGQYEGANVLTDDVAGSLKAVRDVVQWVNGYVGSKIKRLPIRGLWDLDRALIKIKKFFLNSLRKNALTSLSMAGYRAYGLARGHEPFSVCTDHGPWKVDGSGGGRAVKYKLPRPLFNVINGGLHAMRGGVIQEFLIIPKSSQTFEQSVTMGLLVHEKLKKLLQMQGCLLGVGDEGGWVVDQVSTEGLLDTICRACDRANVSLGQDMVLGLDAAASVFFDGVAYNIRGRSHGIQDMIKWYGSLLRAYPIGVLEDGMACQDAVGWSELYGEWGNRIWLVGDDLFASQCRYLRRPEARKMSNALLVKPNQAGTILHLVESCEIARGYRWPIIMSHRSGDTEDSHIADLAVDLQCQGIKSGGFMRSERLAKYNQLLRIEEYLRHGNRYGGLHDFADPGTNVPL